MDFTAWREWGVRRADKRTKWRLQRQAYKRALINVAKPLIAVLTIMLMFGAAEFYFRVIHIESDGFSMTLLGQRWYQNCWHTPLTLTNPAFTYEDNTLHVRDRVWTEADLMGKRKVLVVGDSFSAGHGICDVEQRFSNQLGQQLGSDYAVMNFSYNGWNTPDEAFYAPYFPHDPDVIVLSYYVNDIAPTIQETNGATVTVPALFTRPADTLTAQIINRSYLADYIYWHVIVQRQWAASGEGITNAYLQAFDDAEIWNAHQQELQRIVDWAQRKNAKLVVVMFPILYDLEGSRPALAKVDGFFAAHGAAVINTIDLFAGHSTGDLIISNIDAHPSVWAHGEVAKSLYELIKARGW